MAVPRPRRRWLRFSLGTLLAALTLLSLLIGVQADRAIKQRRAVETIENNGGNVSYAHEDDGSTSPPGPRWLARHLGEDYFRTVVAVSLGPSGSRRGPSEAIAQVDNLPHLRRLWLSCDVNNDDLQYLRSLHLLESLCLENTRVTDDGLQHLAGLTRLETLWIYGDDSRHPPISDRGLAHLQHLKLRTLVIESSRITGHGMAQIVDLSRLNTLGLTFAPDEIAELSWLAGCSQLRLIEWSNIAIGERGWQALAGCQELETIWLRSAKFDDDGIRQLAALPKLTFLELRQSPIEGRSLQALAKLAHLGLRDSIERATAIDLELPRSLYSLQIAGLPIGEEVLAKLNLLPELQTLTLIDVAIGDELFARLHPPKLESLDLVDLPVSQPAIAQFEARTGIKVRVVTSGQSLRKPPLAVP